MYLRQRNKWKEFLLAESIENIGLPSRVVTFIRRRAAFTVHGDAHAAKLADEQGVELQKIDEKHLTWLGQLLKKFDMKLFSVTDTRTLAGFIKKAVRETARGDALDPDDVPKSRRTHPYPRSPEEAEALGERLVDATAPLLDYARANRDELQTLADMKGLRKRMTRALQRAGLPEGEITTAQVIFDTSVYLNLKNSDALGTRLRRIMTVLALDPVYYEEELKKADDLRMAYGLAQVFLDNPKKDPDKVIHEFDNGYFWYDIQSYACDFEGKEMGHCGRGEDGTLYSLRSGKTRKMKPFVTIEFDDGIIYQVKGKGNTAPKKDLWPYISWFIENMDVRRIQEAGQHASDSAGFEEMLEYLQEKHPDLESGSNWIKLATEVLEMGENSISEDSQTSLEIEWPGGDEHIGVAGVVLRHQAYWPIKDIIVDEDTHRLRWEIRHDAQSIADDTLYPNPRIRYVEVFARGVQDSEAAMLRVDMVWDEDFQPNDDEEETVKSELDRLDSYLIEIAEISDYLVSDEAAPEEAKFDYNAFHEGIQKKLEAYGVYRDIAGEQDEKRKREKAELAGQTTLPLQESRIIQRWSRIIK